MSAQTSDVVEAAIRNARKLATAEGHDWSTASAALARILADLEGRAPGDPSLEPLRAFIPDGDPAAKGGRRPGKARERRHPS